MDHYRELAQLIKGATAGSASVLLSQGIVTRVDGILCDIEVGGMTIPDVRLRASQAEADRHLLIVPKVGSAVIVGSLTGDWTQLVILAVDEAESIILNGGKLGGLVNIEPLTAKLNELIQLFNSHTHTAPNGATTPPVTAAQSLNRKDFEDTTIKH